MPKGQEEAMDSFHDGSCRVKKHNSFEQRLSSLKDREFQGNKNNDKMKLNFISKNCDSHVIY